MSTLGQRISEMRKRGNLSQEELGECLGVSRQAISKWESDAAIPEVEKLIALSRRFGVSVGVLLGVEEESEPGAAGAEGLTGDQLDAVERIVSRYLEESGKRDAARKPGRRWPLAIAAVAAVLFAAFVLNYISVLEGRINNLDNSLNGMQSSLSGQIASISGSVQHILEEQASPIADYTVKALVTDVPNREMQIFAEVTPKTYADGMTAILVVEPMADGGWETVRQKMEQEKGTTNFFVSSLPVHLNDEVRVSVLLDDGSGAIQTVRLDTLRGYASATEVEASARYNGPRSLVEDRMTFRGGVSVDLSVSEYMNGKLWPEEAAVQLYQNRKLVDSCSIDCSHWIPGETTALSKDVALDWTHSVQTGDMLALVLHWVDNYGRVRFYCIDRYVITDLADGGITSDSGAHDGRFGRTMYDPRNDRFYDSYDDTVHNA